ncbi:MAG: hypothetical protein AAF515_06305 [Pseudomonadota bacterium]
MNRVASPTSASYPERSRPSALVYALTAFCALAAGSAVADDFAYTYFEAAYVHSDGANGGLLAGSIDVSSNLRLRVGGTRLSESGVDLTAAGAGVDYIARVSETVNVLIGGGINYAEVDAGFFDADSTDASAGVSVRILASPNFEIEPSVGYVFGDFDDAVFGVDARYWFNRNVALQFGIGGSTADGSDAIFELGVRLGPQYR